MEAPLGMVLVLSFSAALGLEISCFPSDDLETRSRRNNTALVHGRIFFVRFEFYKRKTNVIINSIRFGNLFVFFLVLFHIFYTNFCQKSRTAIHS